MTTTLTVADVATVAAIDHGEAMVLAETEFARSLDLLRTLGPEEWHRQTVCELWDVRALVAHVLGMAEAQASLRQFAHDFRAASKRSAGPMIDAMTATQVRERAELTPAQLIERLANVAPGALRHVDAPPRHLTRDRPSDDPDRPARRALGRRLRG